MRGGGVALIARALCILYVLTGCVPGESSSPPPTPTPSPTGPVANAGLDQGNIAPGTVMTLDGSRSTSPSGRRLTYSWTFFSIPGGSAAVLANPGTVSPTFTVDRAGDYIAQLIVNDGIVDSDPAQVKISTNQVAPVADAGPNQAVIRNALVTLDGSRSSDSNGDPITYRWSLTSRPAGSTATLANATTVHPTFTVDQLGDYIAQLIVNDGSADSRPATVTISTSNVAPVANPGPNQTVGPRTLVTLDGSGSTDANRDPLTYSWSLLSIPTGSAAVLANATTVRPTFTVDRAGDYIAQLIVNDGIVDSAPATVRISTSNVAPVANAGPNQTVLPGTLVTLDGSRSTDANGDPLTYSWSLLSKPANSGSVVLTNPGTVHPTFTVDRQAGDYIVQLIVNDGTVNSAPVTVTITTSNVAPVANAGPNQAVAGGTSVTLDGSRSSDANGDPLTYSWSLTSRPAGSAAALANATSAHPTFTADRAGNYIAQLIVSDGTLTSAPATVTISTSNVAPVANAGPDQAVAGGTLVTLNGSGSTDANGDPLTYSWSLTSTPAGSGAVLANATSAHPTFTADRAGNYIAQLIVSDGTLSSPADTVTISTSNVAPVANAGPDQAVAGGTLVTLNGSGSTDANGDPLTYSWSLTSTPAGSTAVLANATSAHPTFTADRAGNYIAQLIVSDGTLTSPADTVTISTSNVAPVANAGPDQAVAGGTLVTLNGSGSTDANRDPLTYSWSLTSTPTGSGAVLANPTTLSPTFIVDRAGDYIAQLIVSDGTLSSTPDTVTISTSNVAPVANAGTNQTVAAGTQVTLDGSGSTDANRDPLTYSWSLTSTPAGSTAVLANPTSVMPTFTADLPGDYVAQLIVSDGTLSSAPATVTITAQ